MSLKIDVVPELPKAPVAVFFYEDEAPKPAALPSAGAALRKELLERAHEENFKGKSGEVLSTFCANNGGFSRYILVGLGSKKGFNNEKLRSAAGHLYHFAEKRYAALGVVPPSQDLQAVEALAEAFYLAAYRFKQYKAQNGKDFILQTVALLSGGAPDAKWTQAVQRASVYAESINFVRDLINQGPSDKSPQTLGNLAKTLSGGGVTAEIMEEEKIRALKMGGLLGVARGSSMPPVFVHLVYKPKGPAKKKIGIIGKGITFDSGGLSLKPPQSMETMKCDMAGAATVLGVFKALKELKPKVEVHGFAPMAYNMPGHDATKPGDVLTAMNGKTIEVLNTDAEGRLILADALAFASQKKLDVLIDLATLTGAVVIALGHLVTAAMTNDKKALEKLLAASQKSGERIWELPLIEDYKEDIKSKFADLQNISSARGQAGTISAGLFLQEFVDSTPWIHLDIAGTAWTDKNTPLCPTGGTGAMVRTLLDYLCAL